MLLPSFSKSIRDLLDQTHESEDICWSGFLNIPDTNPGSGWNQTTPMHSVSAASPHHFLTDIPKNMETTERLPEASDIIEEIEEPCTNADVQLDSHVAHNQPLQHDSALLVALYATIVFRVGFMFPAM
jgi:hypothetical protein